MKITYLRQNSKGPKVWETEFEELRFPLVTNLRMDPFERAVDEAPDYNRYQGERVFFYAPAAEYITQWISSFKQYPPRSKPGTFGIEQVMEKMLSAQGDK